MALHDRLQHLWDDQSELDRLFRPDGPPTNYADRVALTKELSLHMISEIESLLRATGAWKMHRRENVRENREAVKIELADIGKYWMSLCQLNNVTAAEAFDMLRIKSMVVRQRHSEEFVQTLERRSVIVDIDNVLGDYVSGFTGWLENQGLINGDHAQQLRDELPWIDATSLGMTPDLYSKTRHAFRANSGFQMLPVMAGARAFLEWCRERWQVILLTSRPIHEYPNIYADTLIWLDKNHLPYDRIWWTKDKADLVMDRNMIRYVEFAVDDEFRYIEHMASLGIMSFWYAPRHIKDPAKPSMMNVQPVGSLAAIVEFVEKGQTHELR